MFASEWRTVLCVVSATIVSCKNSKCLSTVGSSAKIRNRNSAGSSCLLSSKPSIPIRAKGCLCVVEPFVNRVHVDALPSLWTEVGHCLAEGGHFCMHLWTGEEHCQGRVGKAERFRRIFEGVSPVLH